MSSRANCLRGRQPSDVWRMLGWMAVVAGVATGALVLRSVVGARRQSREALAARQEASLDAMIESSFPASDPPSSW